MDAKSAHDGRKATRHAAKNNNTEIITMKVYSKFSFFKNGERDVVNLFFFFRSLMLGRQNLNNVAVRARALPEKRLFTKVFLAK